MACGEVHSLFQFQMIEIPLYHSWYGRDKTLCRRFVLTLNTTNCHIWHCASYFLSTGSWTFFILTFHYRDVYNVMYEYVSLPPSPRCSIWGVKVVAVDRSGLLSSLSQLQQHYIKVFVINGHNYENYKFIRLSVQHVHTVLYRVVCSHNRCGD